MADASVSLAGNLEVLVKNVFPKMCCTKCGKAAELVIQMAKSSPELQVHLSSVLANKSLKFEKRESATPHYDPDGQKITLPHLDPKDMADGLVFESFNAAQTAEYTAMKDYKDEVVRWGTKRAQVEGNTMLNYAQAAKTLPGNLQTDNMKKAIGKLDSWGGEFVSKNLDEAHDSTATDSRCLPTKKLYIYQQLENLGTDQLCSAFGKLVGVSVGLDDKSQIMFVTLKKAYTKTALCPSDAKFDTFVLFLNWTRKVWPSNFSGGKPANRPRALWLIIEQVQSAAPLIPFRNVITLNAFGLDDAEIQKVANTQGKTLNASVFVYS